jgi:threonine dehydratase
MSKFLTASNNLSGILNDTHVYKSRNLSDIYNMNVFLKPENLQLTGSYKIRGAYNKIYNLSNSQKERGIITASAGNHAQGVGFSANMLDVKCIVVMANNTPLIKVNETKKYGVEVILHGNSFDEAYLHALAISDEKNYTFVHPFDDEDVISGQGTVGVEILNEVANLDAIIIPIGGGGLISGVSQYVKSINPAIKIIGVEPIGAASMSQSLSADEVVVLDKISTIADGAAVKKVGCKNFEYVKNYVDEIIQVDDIQILDAFLMMVEKEKLVVENAGLLSVCALNSIKGKYQNVCCILSGGNIDVLTMSQMIQRGLILRDRLLVFEVLLPNQPGELVNISQIICDLSGNVIKLEHNQFACVDRFHEVGLKVTVETFGTSHRQKIINAIKDCGYELSVF